jgi:hypothetical protein
VQGIRDWFDETGPIPVELVGDLVDEGGGNDNALGKTSGQVGTKQPAGRTDLCFTVATRFARPTGDERINGDAASIVSSTNEFVTHDEGGHPKAGVTDAVKFTATDARPGDVDHFFAVTGDDVGDVHHGHHIDCGEYECSHVSPFVSCHEG